jgi:nucleoside-diphosphate-sugar epimerase
MKILITGAAGNLGSYMSGVLTDTYDLVLTDNYLPEKKPKGFIKADLTDFNAVKKLCKGVDVVLHFAASSKPNTPWEDLLPNNVIATRNVFEAAALAGCKRVVFASSLHVVGAYPDEVMDLKPTDTKPANLYGVTKLFAESLASYYATERKLSVFCLRFGWIADKNNPNILLSNIGEKPKPSCSRVIIYEDAAQLIKKCITAPARHRFGIFNALSNNRLKRLDISSTEKTLNYKPAYDAYRIAEKNEALLID